MLAPSFEYDETASPSWLVGSGTLGDHHWEMMTSDWTKRVKPRDRNVNFDVPIAPGLLLTDASMSADLRTAKLLLWTEMQPGGTVRTEPGLASRARMYIHFVRWRLHQKLFSNADLTSEWIAKLMVDLRERGRSKLVPSTQIATEYTSSVLAGEAEPPVMQLNGKRVFDVNEALFHMGFSHTAQLDRGALDQLVFLNSELDLEPGKSRILVPGYVEQPVGATVSMYMPFLSMLDSIWAKKNFLTHDQIQFRPFENKSISALAEALSKKELGRTETIESKLICELIDHALTWVLDFSAPLIEFKKLIEEIYASDTQQVTSSKVRVRRALRLAARRFVFPDAADNTPWPMSDRFSKTRWEPNGLEVETAIFHYLPAACMVLIAAFSARRKVEIISLKPDCCFEENGIRYLRTYIGKTIQDVDNIPVPASVHKAARVLEELMGVSSSFLSEIDNRFIEIEGLKKPITAFYLERHLSRFSQHVGVEYDPKPHEFRRYFAVLYFNRFRYGHLTALSMFLRHNSLEMTRRYVTESHRTSSSREQSPMVI